MATSALILFRRGNKEKRNSHFFVRPVIYSAKFEGYQKGSLQFAAYLLLNSRARSQFAAPDSGV
jgi:hypothetical protein